LNSPGVGVGPRGAPGDTLQHAAHTTLGAARAPNAGVVGLGVVEGERDARGAGATQGLAVVQGASWGQGAGQEVVAPAHHLWRVQGHVARADTASGGPRCWHGHGTDPSDAHSHHGHREAAEDLHPHHGTPARNSQRASCAFAVASMMAPPRGRGMAPGRIGCSGSGSSTSRVRAHRPCPLRQLAVALAVWAPALVSAGTCRDLSSCTSHSSCTDHALLLRTGHLCKVRSWRPMSVTPVDGRAGEGKRRYGGGGRPGTGPLLETCRVQRSV
jgi:hypothetical protein